MNVDQNAVLGLLCAIPAFVLGLTLHEWAHAWSAMKLGDDTAKRAGRVTLDPLAHLDLWGSLFFVVMWFSGFGLGWAKPVPVNSRNLGNPRRDDALVAIAGPISNLLQVPFWLLAVVMFGFASVQFGFDLSPGSIPSALMQALIFGVVINVMLAAFNMIPIPPLDGHWVLQSLGGPPIEQLFDTIRPYAFLLLILLVSFTPFLGMVLGPINAWVYELAYTTLGVGRSLAS